MKNEIERKFFVRELPSLSEVKPLHYERYILSKENGKETRIQKIDDSYTYEEKSDLSDLERIRVKRDITKEEFEAYRAQSNQKAILRERYNISSNPDIAIQIYHGDFEGLVRAEVEFTTEEEAKSFQPLPWMGKEMTGLPIARDALLLEVSRTQLEDYLENRF